MSKEEDKKVLTFSSLADFFYPKLAKLNFQRPTPVPDKALEYSCIVLESYLQSQALFEEDLNGRLKHKVLGLRLIEQTHKKDPLEIKDVADTSLIMTGVFKDFLQRRKLLSLDYYIEIGVRSYASLDGIYPSPFKNEQGFYKLMSRSFRSLVELLAILNIQLASQRNEDQFMNLSGLSVEGDNNKAS